MKVSGLPGRQGWIALDLARHGAVEALVLFPLVVLELRAELLPERLALALRRGLDLLER